MTLWLLLGGGCGGEGAEQSAEDASAPATVNAAAAQVTPEGESAESATDRVRTNQAPTARFEVLPPQGYAGMTRFRLDASFSSDDFNLAGEMFKRWDFEGDGEWDTRFSRATRIGYTYSEAGVFRPRLEIRDTGGKTDSTCGSAVTVLENCPAPDFALIDENPNSATHGRICRLSDYRGRRVVLWLASPSS